MLGDRASFESASHYKTVLEELLPQIKKSFEAAKADGCSIDFGFLFLSYCQQLITYDRKLTPICRG